MKQVTLPVIILALVLAGCGGNGKVTAPDVPAEEQTTLTGMPLSVFGSTATHSAPAVVAIIIHTETKRIACSTSNKGREQHRVFPDADAISLLTALVQSEIDDGDQQPIVLHGKFNQSGIFVIDDVEVEGYTITIREKPADKK